MVWVTGPEIKFNPNPKTDPNPKSNNNVCSTKRHRNQVQHNVMYITYFPRERGVVIKGL